MEMETEPVCGNAIMPARQRALRAAATEAMRRVLGTDPASPERARAETEAVAACLAIRGFHAALNDHAPTVELYYLRDCAAAAAEVARTTPAGPARLAAEGYADGVNRMFLAYRKQTFGPAGPDRTVKLRYTRAERPEIPMRDIDLRYQPGYWK